ncbi:MAG: SCP-like extracellular [Acidimicrobiia bacterium]|nr:SCP-like extracellular [Acidimicrobiia bacterium]
MSRLVSIAAVTGALFALSACDPATQYAGSVTADQEVVGAVNARRATDGKGALRIDVGLESAAQRWADELARSGVLRHSDSLAAGRHFSVAGENVGTGSNLDQVSDAFNHSPAHLANIVDKRYTLIGVGVATDGNGRVWVVEQFMKPA